MYKIQKILFPFLLVVALTPSIFGQTLGLKSNFLYWGTVTPNLGMEFSLGPKTTLEVGGGYHPFALSNDKRFKHWLVQPELRYWFCEGFNGHFLGLHFHGAQYNVGGIDIPFGWLDILQDNRYQGYLYGGGLSYGYQWILSKRWNLELNLGGGYARIHYEKFPCQKCGTKEKEGNYDYFGVTKAAVSLIYVIK